MKLNGRLGQDIWIQPICSYIAMHFRDKYVLSRLNNLNDSPPPHIPLKQTIVPTRIGIRKAPMNLAYLF